MILVLGCVSNVKRIPSSFSGQLRLSWHLVTMHEEADTRILVHTTHASLNGMKKILVRTVDIDVVILAIAFAKKLEVEEPWVAFGVGKHLRYLPIHMKAGFLTTQEREGPPFFHAFTRCDTVSYFIFFCKEYTKTEFQAWKY